MSETELPREIKSTHPDADKEVAISPEVRLMIQAEIRDQLDRERAILLDAGSLTLKIVGGAFALLLAIFTIFGLTTWKDIANQTIAYMKQKADGLIQSSDSEIGVKQTLNDLVNRAIVAAELTSLSRQAGMPLDLPKFEWDRLKAWLKSESLEEQQFEDTLAILERQSSERKKVDANGFLSEMLNPPDASPYRWMLKQPQKRLAIMEDFKNADLGASALAIAQSSAVSDDLRLAAIKYIRDVDFTYAFEKILAIASTADDDLLKSEALLTSAKLRPTNPRFLAEVGKLMAQSNSSSMSTAIKIVAVWWERGRWSDPGTEKQVVAMSKKLLAFAFDGGAYFELITPPLGHALGERLPPPHPSFVSVRTSQSWERDMTSLTLQDLDHLRPYWELLEDAANDGDGKKVSAYMFLTGYGRRAFSAELGMGENSTLVIEDAKGGGVTLKAGDASEIILVPAFRSGDLSVVWTKDHIAFNEGKIWKLSGGGFHLSLRTNWDEFR